MRIDREEWERERRWEREGGQSIESAIVSSAASSDSCSRGEGGERRRESEEVGSIDPPLCQKQATTLSAK